MVTDQDIAKGVESLLRHSDPNSITTVNGVVQQLEAKLGFDLSHKAGFIRDQIDLLLRSQPPPFLPSPSKDHFALNPHHQQPYFPTTHFPPHFALHSHHEINFQQHPHPPPPPQYQPPASEGHAFYHQNVVTAVAPPEAPKQSVPTGAKKRGGAGGLNKVCGVSPELQPIVGESALPRTEIVRQLWAYIRKHNLQDPGNKRKIICDDALRVVFETDCTDMFKMNKLLAKHIIPLGPTKAPQAKRMKVEAESVLEMAEPASQAKQMSAEVKAEAESALEMAEPASQANQVMVELKAEAESAHEMAEPAPQANQLNVEGKAEAKSSLEMAEPASSTVTISEALAKFLGTGGREMLQSEALRLVWEYIKLNHLEDPFNAMVIVCDAKLQELLGCESISAFGIPEMLARHHLFKQSNTC